MRRILTTLALLGLLGASTPAPVAAAGDPNCAPSTTWLESHSWWREKGEPFPGRHIHVSTCFPLGATAAGFDLDIRVDVHGKPGPINWVRVQAWPQMDPAFRQTVNWTCATDDCTWHIRARATFTFTGWTELRVTVNIPQNVFGQRQFQTTRWPLCARACSSTLPRVGAGGWYLDQYQNAYTDLGKRLMSPVTGPLAFRAKGDRNRVIVAVDPDSHAGDPGIVLGTTTSHDWQTYTIPRLSAGWHKLFVRTEQDFAMGMSAGQHVQAFLVQ